MTMRERYFYRRVGAHLRRRRRAIDRTQQQVAAAAHIPRVTLAHYEGGTVAIPLHRYAQVIAALGVEVSVAPYAREARL